MAFTKPVKYIFVGNPHLTKTTIAKKLHNIDNIFETDVFNKKHNNIYDLNEFNLNAKLFIIGGKHYKKWYQKWWILKKLINKLEKDNIVITLKFNRRKRNSYVNKKYR